MARQLEEVEASPGTDEEAELEKELRAMGIPLSPGALSAVHDDLPRYPRRVERLLTPVAWVLRKIDRFHAERSRARFRAGMKELEAELAEFDDFPPLDEEEIERLRASGVRVPDRTGPLPDWDWEPAPQRPRWLAFLFRVLRIWR